MHNESWILYTNCRADLILCEIDLQFNVTFISVICITYHHLVSPIITYTPLTIIMPAINILGQKNNEVRVTSIDDLLKGK